MTPNPNPSPELLPCPFCGNPMEDRGYGAMHTDGARCILAGYAFEAHSAWNTRTLSQTLPAPGEVPELECEYDPDGSYALIWKSGYAITAFPNGKVAITKSNRGDGFYPFGCDVSELTTLATVAAANDEGVAKAGAALVEAWNSDGDGFSNTLPPIEFSEAELAHLVRAVLWSQSSDRTWQPPIWEKDNG